MKKHISILTSLIVFFISLNAKAGQVCLEQDQYNQVKLAIQELDKIHKAEARIEVLDSIYIIHDWDGRVYVSGGSQKPIRMRLHLSEYIDRDMNATIQPVIFYRPKPPDPMFRLRYRAQVGVLLPQLVYVLKNKENTGWDAGIGFDFFHYKDVNVSVDAGVFSAGASVGLDLTKNFGVNAGYHFIYGGFQSGAYIGPYFSFN